MFAVVDFNFLITYRSALPLEKQKIPKAKDGDNNLKFSDCTPDIQKGLRKARSEEWQKWMKYNAGVVLTQSELEHIISQGVTIQPIAR